MARWKEQDLDLRERGPNYVMPIRVSAFCHKKAAQLNKFLVLNGAKSAWGKDQALIRTNLLQVPTSINYRVLLAMGRKN